MDKIQLLQERKAKMVESSKGIREDIAAIIDENSFVYENFCGHFEMTVHISFQND